MITSSRRVFLGGLGTGALTLGLGASFQRRGYAGIYGEGALDFGELEGLAALMQETAPSKLQPLLIDRLRAGATLETLTAAGSLANARSFGGHDYIGYHCMMAMDPALAMARELPQNEAPLPVLKVLYRNAARIRATGGRDDALRELPAPKRMSREAAAARFRDAVLAREIDDAEEAFAALAAIDKLAAYEELQTFVQENLDVHKVVLAWRAWDALRHTGNQHALTLLRQSVRFCIDREQMRLDRGNDVELRTLVPELLERHELAAGAPGKRHASDQELDELCHTMFASSRKDAAAAMAHALAGGLSMHDAGEALSLAANQLLIRDPGRRTDDDPKKPKGSVHGASTGVHAADSARAWRHIANVTGPRTAVASLIAGAYHTAGRSQYVGDKAIPYRDLMHEFEKCDARELLDELSKSVEGRDQKRACAVTRVYAERDLAPDPLFGVLLRYGVGADGALHAEKYFHTVREEFAVSRERWRWDYVVSLARVTTSEYGWPAPGLKAARAALS